MVLIQICVPWRVATSGGDGTAVRTDAGDDTSERSPSVGRHRERRCCLADWSRVPPSLGLDGRWSSLGGLLTHARFACRGWLLATGARSASSLRYWRREANSGGDCRRGLVFARRAVERFGTRSSSVGGWLAVAWASGGRLARVRCEGRGSCRLNSRTALSLAGRLAPWTGSFCASYPPPIDAKRLAHSPKGSLEARDS